jgi:hypothetical protein
MAETVVTWEILCISPLVDLVLFGTLGLPPAARGFPNVLIAMMEELPQ